MQQVYLDINGDVLNEVLGLRSTNRIDEVLESIIESAPEPIKAKVAEKAKKKDSKKSKVAAVEEVKMRMIKVKRV